MFAPCSQHLEANIVLRRGLSAVFRGILQHIMSRISFKFLVDFRVSVRLVWACAFKLFYGLDLVALGFL
jgi:hypothetical protein